MNKDIMHITTPFLRGIVSKAIDNTVQSKTGYSIQSSINDLKIEVADDSKVHLDLDISITKEELTKILAQLGLS